MNTNNAGKSIVTAIHHVTTLIMMTKGAHHFIFDIQGAFNNSSFGVIERKLCRKSVPDIIRNWLLEMLSSIVIKLDLGESPKSIQATIV